MRPNGARSRYSAACAFEKAASQTIARALALRCRIKISLRVSQPARRVKQAYINVDRMKALVYTAPRRLQMLALPDPSPKPAEALVRVRAARVCGSARHASPGRRRKRVPP